MKPTTFFVIMHVYTFIWKPNQTCHIYTYIYIVINSDKTINATRKIGITFISLFHKGLIK